MSEKELNKLKVTQSDKFFKKNHWKFLFSILLLLSVIIGVYIYLFNTEPRRILLGSEPIELGSKNSTNIKTDFLIGERIYLLYDHKEVFPKEALTIKVYQGNQNAIEISSILVNLPTDNKSFATHFQKNFFTERGNYSIKILSVNGNVLASTNFSLQ